MVEIVRRLRQEHANMAKLLNALERQLAVFDEAGAPDYDVIQGVIDYCLTYPDQCHHPKEDLVYQKLQDRDPAAAERVGNLEAEHATLATLTGRLGEAVRNVLLEIEVSRDSFDHLTRNFLETYRRHIRMEEEVFFPAALNVLTEEDWAEIDAHVTDRDDPLFGEQAEERFKPVLEDILAWDRADRENQDAPAPR